VTEMDAQITDEERLRFFAVNALSDVRQRQKERRP
jgi:hypothetical protein